MDISEMNLNLLTAFEALMIERNVTRAGERMGITQSAMSNILIKLRSLFQDQLFIRSGKTKMDPTEKAKQLAPKIHAIVHQAEALLVETQPFNPSTSDRVFAIGMSDYIEMLFLPKLVEILKARAPKISIQVKHFNQFYDPAVFNIRKIDLILGEIEDVPQAIKQQTLFYDEGVVIGRKDNPLFSHKMSLKEYLSAEHVQSKYFVDTEHCASDIALEKLGYKRHELVSLPHLFMAFFLVQKNNMITTGEKRIADLWKDMFDIVYQPTPFRMPKIRISQLWHEEYHEDIGNKWLRGIMKEIAQTL